MKKTILFTLTNVICLTSLTTINAMEWKSTLTIIRKYDSLYHCGYNVVLSHNATWQQFRHKQDDEKELITLGNYIENAYHKKSSDFHAPLLKIITKSYIETIIEQENLAPRRYNRPEDQEKYNSFINDLRKQLQE